MDIKDYIGIAREIKSDIDKQALLDKALSDVVSEFLITDISAELKEEFLAFITEMGRDLSDKHLVDLRKRDEFALILSVQAVTTGETAKIAEAVWVHDTPGLETDKAAFAEDMNKALDNKTPLNDDLMNTYIEKSKELFEFLDGVRQGDKERIAKESQTPLEAFIEALEKFIQTIRENLKESKESISKIVDTKWTDIVKSQKGGGLER